MSLIYYLKTATRAAIQAAIAGAGIYARRPTIESDGGRFRVGNRLVTETDVAADASVSSTGTSTLALKSWCAQHVATFTVGAGSGAYTRKILALRTVTDLNGGTALAPLKGDTITIKLAVAASANPTVQIHENSASDSALLTIAGTGTAFSRTVQLHYTGSAWAVLNEGSAPSSGGSVTFASQEEAEAGTDTTKSMNPLRTAQAIAELAPGGTTTLIRVVNNSLQGHTTAAISGTYATGALTNNAVGPWKLTINGTDYTQPAGAITPLNLPSGWTEDSPGFVKDTVGAGNTASATQTSSTTPSLSSWTDGDESTPATLTFGAGSYTEGDAWSFSGGGLPSGPYTTQFPTISGWTWASNVLTKDMVGAQGSTPTLSSAGSAPTFSFTDGVTPAAASGATAEVEIIAAVAGKKIGILDAYCANNLNVPIQLAWKKDGIYTPVAGNASSSDTFHVFEPATFAEALNFLRGHDAGESLVAFLDGTIPTSAEQSSIVGVFDQYTA